MAVSHGYFRADGLNATGYIDDYTYAKAAKQSSKVRRPARPIMIKPALQGSLSTQLGCPYLIVDCVRHASAPSACAI